MSDLLITGPMTMDEVARRLGLHYDTFRKRWRDLPGFPSPLYAKRWDGAAVEAWIRARSHAQPPAASSVVAFRAKPKGRLAALRAGG